MPRLEQRLVQKQILAPQQILQATLLQLNSVSLEDRILDELEKNPVLEQVESEVDTETLATEAKKDELDISFDDNDYEPATVYSPKTDNVDLPMPDRHDFIEDIVLQLVLYDLTDEEHTIAEEILWNLDNRGYLATDLLLIADRFGKTEEQILPILSLVQHLDPPAIAARDLQECLLIQLEDDKDSLPYKLVEKHFEDFANKRFELLERKLGCTEKDLSDAIEVISHLNPRPGEGKILTRDELVVPDIIIREGENGWIIRTNDGNLPELRISAAYEEMLHKPSKLTAGEKKFLRDKTDAANWFIKAILQRRQTMTKVMKAIIQRQSDFFSGDTNNLKPMKLQDIAEEISMDISTISRSTRGKYVDAPFGVFELKTLFTEGMIKNDGELISTSQIKQALHDIVEKEDKHNPFNDETLVGKLKDAGYKVARRTVAKYREQLNLPVARLRREI
jgi:RNA polymerase sigma-54 factor